MFRLIVCSLVVTFACNNSRPSNPDQKKEQPPANATSESSRSASSEVVAGQAMSSSPLPLLDEVTAASPAYEQGKPVVTAGRVDGNELRRLVRKRIANDYTPVTVMRGDDSKRLGRNICDKTLPKTPTTLPVLIRPNIGGFAWFKKASSPDNGVSGRTTDPQFVRGIVECLRARGYTKITIADGWSGDAKYWQRLMEVSGYGAIAKELGVELVALNDDGHFDAMPGAPGKPLVVSGMDKTSVPTLAMPKIVAEHLQNGLYIAAPKVKTHRFSVISVAIKGLQGAVMYTDKAPAYKQKWRSHKELGPIVKAYKNGRGDRVAYVAALESFATRMTDVLEVEAPHVVMAEGAPAMGGDGFHSLTPYPQLFAVGGTNPIAVDKVCASLLGLWNSDALAKALGGHRTSPLITAAAKRFGFDTQKVRVIGNGASLVATAKPYLIGMADFTIGVDPNEADKPAGEVVKPSASAVALGNAKIKIDGVADESVWSNAEAVSFSSDFRGDTTDKTTRIKFAYSNEGLYALVEIENAAFNVTAAPLHQEHRALYKEDCVEIFLGVSSKLPGTYYEIELGPMGHYFDLSLDDRRKPKRDLDWSAGLRLKTKVDKANKRAVIEVAMEGPDIRKLLTKGSKLPLGLFRIDGKPKSFLAWSPPRTKKPKFHVPSSFGTLVLE